MQTSFSRPISTSSPLVSAVMSKKKHLHEAQSKLKWGLANLHIAIFLFLEANLTSCHFLLDELSPWRTGFSRFENAVLLILLINGVLDLCAYMFPFGVYWSSSNDITLTQKQMKLFGVSPKDIGFKASPAPKPSDKGHPYGFSPPLDGSFIQQNYNSPVLINSPSVLGASTLMSSADSSSWVFSPGQHQKSPHHREPVRPKTSVDGTISDEKKLHDYLQEFETMETSGLYNNLPGGNTSMSGQPTNLSTSNSPSFWRSPDEESTKSRIPDFSGVLKKIAYQLSTPMPFSSSSSLSLSGPGSNKKSSHDTKSESLCAKLDIDPLNLVFWMQNIRIWISETILKRVVSEIDETNQKLTKVGLTDALIGTVGVERLKKCAALPQLQGQLPKLSNLLPFLNITIHQDYLVHRLRELSKGGAMSEFKWNSGGRYKGQEWTDKLPSDAELVMHLFSTYLDVRMPANYRNTTTNSMPGNPSHSHFIDDKPFSGVYFIRLPEMELGAAKAKSPAAIAQPSDRDGDQTKKTGIDEVATTVSFAREVDHSITILQTSQRPPHFLLQLDGKEKLEISSGRNNLFHTILFFLHFVKTKESGMLGRINLGPSGINILWVID